MPRGNGLVGRWLLLALASWLLLRPGGSRGSRGRPEWEPQTYVCARGHITELPFPGKPLAKVTCGTCGQPAYPTRR